MRDRTDASVQQPCVHCGECARACPESLDPDALFLALVKDDFGMAQGERLDACSECNRCAEVCPSHIPLPDWFRWGKSELRERMRAEDARQRYLARNTRLTRERELRGTPRGTPLSVALPAQTISRSEVLAAIARGKARVRAVVPGRGVTQPPASPNGKNS
jgi:electron transport complex protein RnfC